MQETKTGDWGCLGGGNFKGRVPEIRMLHEGALEICQGISLSLDEY